MWGGTLERKFIRSRSRPQQKIGQAGLPADSIYPDLAGYRQYLRNFTAGTQWFPSLLLTVLIAHTISANGGGVSAA
jgi:hypothetical protein